MVVSNIDQIWQGGFKGTTDNLTSNRNRNIYKAHVGWLILRNQSAYKKNKYDGTFSVIEYDIVF